MFGELIFIGPNIGGSGGGGGEPPIIAATVADYYRGDKTFQPLIMDALGAVTSGAAAAVGKVGEIDGATQAANTVTGVGATGAWGNVVSKSLAAGDWLVYGSVGFNANGAVLTDFVACAVSDSATGVGLDEFDTSVVPFISGGGDTILPTPHKRINIAAPTTIYLNTKFNYSSGLPRHRGKITAIRVR